MLFIPLVVHALLVFGSVSYRVEYQSGAGGGTIPVRFPPLVVAPDFNRMSMEREPVVVFTA